MTDTVQTNQPLLTLLISLHLFILYIYLSYSVVIMCSKFLLHVFTFPVIAITFYETKYTFIFDAFIAEASDS